jgi:hypothetical protein
MLREEEGLSGDFTIHRSGRWRDRCGWAVRSGGNGDLSSSERGFLHKRNSKEGGEWMRRSIMRLPMTFIGRKSEGTWYRGGEIFDSK